MAGILSAVSDFVMKVPTGKHTSGYSLVAHIIIELVVDHGLLLDKTSIRT